jgi:hypothetical protein
MDDPKDIATTVKSLESALDGVAIKLAIATAAVVFGLLIEYQMMPGRYPALMDCIRFRRLSDWNALEKHVRSAIIGGLFITFGVSAELWYEHRTNVLEAQLQTENGLLIATLNEKASSADARAKLLENSTQQLRTDEEMARKSVADANRKAGEANSTAEREKLERQQLAVLVSPRTLSVEQQNKIGAACKGSYATSPNNRIRVESYGLDGEGAALAQEIVGALTSGSLYSSVAIGATVQSGQFDTGVLISSPPEAIDFANCLATAFTKIGRLAEVKVNGERHLGGARMGGNATMGGNASMGGGGNPMRPAGPLPPGSPIEIMVGIRSVAVAVSAK